MSHYYVILAIVQRFAVVAAQLVCRPVKCADICMDVMHVMHHVQVGSDIENGGLLALGKALRGSLSGCDVSLKGKTIQLKKGSWFASAPKLSPADERMHAAWRGVKMWPTQV